MLRLREDKSLAPNHTANKLAKARFEPKGHEAPKLHSFHPSVMLPRFSQCWANERQLCEISEPLPWAAFECQFSRWAIEDMCPNPHTPQPTFVSNPSLPLSPSKALDSSRTPYISLIDIRFPVRARMSVVQVRHLQEHHNLSYHGNSLIQCP